MPDISKSSPSDPKDKLFDAIANKDLKTIRQVVSTNPKINLNCLDKDELTPLQHACHTGDIELAKYLLDKGADVNYTSRKDGYTPLMFAAISSRVEVVRLLLERGVDTTIENCVHRTAAQMAAFVGQSKIVAVINSWVSYADSAEPFTRCRELESKPRISSPSLGRLLHSYIVYPSLHPVKLLLYIKENLDLIKYANEFIYALETLSSRSLKPPNNDESQSLKYYYLSYLIECCIKFYKSKNPQYLSVNSETFEKKTWDKCLENIIRHLIRRDDPNDIKQCNQQLDRFIMECMMKYPYTHLGIFKTMTFALTKRDVSDLTALAILVQSLNGPRMFGQTAEACTICGETDKTMKCSQCKSLYYCSSSCQLADWFQHKKICRSPEEIPLLDDIKES